MRRVSIARRIRRAMVWQVVVLCSVFTAFSLLLAYIIEDAVFVNVLQSESRRVQAMEPAERAQWAAHAPRMRWYARQADLPAPLQAVPGDAAGVYEHFSGAHAVFVQRLADAGTQDGPFMVYDVSDLLVVRGNRWQWLVPLTLVAAVLLLLTLFVAFKVSARTLNPLKKLTRHLQSGELDPQALRTLAAAFEADEIAVLADHLQLAVQRIHDDARKAFEFNRGLSHELRTPLQVAGNALELLRMRQDALGADPALARLQRAVTQMQDICAAFLWLVRGAADAGSCDAADVLRQRIELHSALHPRHQFELHGTDGALPCPVPREVLAVMIDNLLRNAVQHGSGRDIACRLRAGQFSVSNRLDATAEEDASGGNRVGLLIVERFCQRLDWRLELRSDGDERIRATLNWGTLASAP